MKFPTLVSLVLALATVTPAQAQSSRVEDVIKYRQALFKVMGSHLSRLSAMAKGETPFDKNELETHAQLLNLLAKQVGKSFPAGSDVEPSKAKSEVWKEQDKFKSAADRTLQEASKLAASARSVDAATLTASLGQISSSCKACHESFRGR